MSSKKEIMGFLIDSLTMEETIEKVKGIINSKKKCQHAVLNAGKIVMANKDEKLKYILNGCEIVNADGQSVVWASKILGQSLPERVTGVDLMEKLIDLSDKGGYRIYFFGAEQEIIEKAIDVYKSKYPGLQVAGYRNGYFKDEDIPQIIESMNNSNADILFVGISSPKKEYWLNDNIDRINIPFCMGVGGSFDIAAGKTSRAPVWMQKTGFEWLYRLVQEPKRMWKRYLVGNFMFIYYVLKELLRKKRCSKA